jgi:serine/threonine protein kinase
MELADRMLGQFQIVEQVGKGGMATVYKAYQTNLQRYVALKVLSPRLADDLELVKRFLREARSAAALRHPNVMIIHDVGSEGDLHYIVSELLEGIPLAQLLQQEGALPPERVLNIMRQMAGALDYAHSRGYIHRDIKPSNIMIDPGREDHATLMDFGLVQVAGGSRMTRTGFIMGTPDYMSPEQAKGDPVDHRTDVYSLGVTLYHALTGTVPFTKSTPHAVLLAHIMEDPPSMSTTEHDIPSEVEVVVRKAMVKDPRDRYEWAGDLANDLEMAVRHPEAFTAPPDRPSIYPQSPPTMQAQPSPLSGETEQASGRIPATPPPYAADAQSQPRASSPTVAAGRRANWVWPVVGLTSFAMITVLVILGILFWPQIQPLLLTAQPTVIAAATATQTPAPQILLFDVSPGEITQGDSVTLAWRATGVDSVTIDPNIREEGLPEDTMVHQPAETTIYRLELPGGVTREAEVVVLPAPRPPVIEYFRADPPEQVQGQEFTLSWQVSGDTSQVEISRGFEMIRGLGTMDQLVLVAEETTTFVLNAYHDDLVSTAKIEFRAIEPTPTSTHTPQPTAVPTATPTPRPTATATLSPPTPTPPKPTATPARSSGVIYAFEDFGTWKRGDQPYGEFTQSREQVQSGSYAGKLTYDFTAAGSTDDFVVFGNPAALSGQPNVITAWVYGDGSGHFVNAWVEDAQRQVWSVHLGALSFSGWQQLMGLIEANRPWPSGKVFGPDNGVIDYPIRFYAIVLDRPGSGPAAGQIYFDDIAVARAIPGTPEETSTPQAGEPTTGQIGRIVFTVRVDETRYSLYTTDPGWTKAVKIGDTDWNNSTCVEGNAAATTFDGTSISLRPVERCQIAGTVGSCPSPDGRFKVNTNNMGDRFSVVLFNVAENRIQEAYYEGALNIYVGLNWAPDGSHFLFTADSSVYRADVGRAGVYRVIPFKDTEWPLQYSPDGSMVMYLKPVNGAIGDVFVAQPDGSGERNLTNASISVKLCPRWQQQ